MVEIITKDHIRIRYEKRRGIKMIPRYITIHSNANPYSTAKNERDNLDRESNKDIVSFHYAVDENNVIECIPPNEVAYHATHKVGNSSSVGIEMCEKGNRQKVINKTIQLVKYLQKKYNISDDKVVRHYDWNRKNCPRILNYNNWQGWVEFKTLLRSEKMTEEQVRQIVNEEINKRMYLKEDNWATEMWKTAQANEWTDGERPQAFATRQEVMGMITKVLDNLKK